MWGVEGSVVIISSNFRMPYGRRTGPRTQRLLKSQTSFLEALFFFPGGDWAPGWERHRCKAFLCITDKSINVTEVCLPHQLTGRVSDSHIPLWENKRVPRSATLPGLITGPQGLCNLPGVFCLWGFSYRWPFPHPFHWRVQEEGHVNELQLLLGSSGSAIWWEPYWAILLRKNVTDSQGPAAFQAQQKEVAAARVIIKWNAEEIKGV